MAYLRGLGFFSPLANHSATPSSFLGLTKRRSGTRREHHVTMQLLFPISPASIRSSIHGHRCLEILSRGSAFPRLHVSVTAWAFRGISHSPLIVILLSPDLSAEGGFLRGITLRSSCFLLTGSFLSTAFFTRSREGIAFPSPGSVEGLLPDLHGFIFPDCHARRFSQIHWPPQLGGGFPHALRSPCLPHPPFLSSGFLRGLSLS